MEVSSPEDAGADAFEENGTHVDFENLSLRLNSVYVSQCLRARLFGISHRKRLSEMEAEVLEVTISSKATPKKRETFASLSLSINCQFMTMD
jgi:hypothetical protein